MDILLLVFCIVVCVIIPAIIITWDDLLDGAYDDEGCKHSEGETEHE